MLEPKSEASEKILYYHCKAQAVNDLILALREKEMDLEEGLKLVRQLSKKQFKIQQKMKRLIDYASNN